MLKKFRKVEFGGEIGVILQQSRVLLHDLQYTVQFAIKVFTFFFLTCKKVIIINE